MKDIADTTGGKYYESPTILGLLSIYYQIQGDLQLGEMTNLETGTKTSGNDTRIVTIDRGTKEATFVLGWLQDQGSLSLSIKTPSGDTISKDSPNAFFGEGSTFSFLRIMNPAAGDWEVHILRTDSNSISIDYTFGVFVKGASKLWSFIPDFTPAGDCLLTKVKLFDTQTLQPITGATVNAVISSPKQSKFTLNYQYVKPTAISWNPRKYMNQALTPTTRRDRQPQWISTLQSYDQKSLQSTGNSIFQYDTETVALYDDGTHGDEQAGDGTYTNCIENTKISGSYNIRFSISGVTPSGGKFKRQQISTAVVQPGTVDPSRTLVRVDPKIIAAKEGSEGIITVIPMDQYGNVWGPRFKSRISVSTTAGVLTGELIDNSDGFYFYKIKSSGVEGVGQIKVMIDGVEIEAQPKVEFQEVPYPFSLSLHVGSAIPVRDFSKDYKTGLNLLVDFDYHFSPKMSFVGFLGYNEFKSKTTGIDDNYWINLSANVRYEIQHPSNFIIYLGGGLGYYIPKTGNSGLGFNLGFAINYDINRHLFVEFGADYHRVFGKDVEFLHSHVGLVYRF